MKTDKRWVNLGCRDGLYCLVTDGESQVRLATPADADAVVDMLNAMERDAAFGRQCIQDDCEGAWIAATVHKQATARIARLESLLSRVLAQHDEPCRLDHNGFCQAHGCSTPCVYHEIREELG